MERLNDIVGRTAQRRQHLSDQRLAPEPPVQGQRSQPPAARRPLPEQTARLGQPTNYAAQRYDQQTYASRTHAIPAPEETTIREARLPGAAAPRPIYTHNRPRIAPNTPNAYLQRSRPLEEVRSEHPLMPRPSTQEYHRADTYTHALQADVMEEWEEEEETATNMRYGDWEEDANEVQSYAQANVEAGPHPRSGRPMPPREVPEAEAQRRVTRNLSLREVHNIPVPQPPVTQARTQDIYRSQRNTQPLSPHTFAGMSRERDMPHDPQHIQRSTRQPTFREQEQPPNHAPASVPQPMTARGICPKCRGAGYLRIDVPFGHPNFGKPVACECKEIEKKDKRRQQLLELSDLTAFHNKNFKNFNTRFSGVHPIVQEAFQEAYEFAHNPDGWLFLIGPNGCGKTHLAAAIANQCLSSGAVVLFAVVPDLLAHLRATFAPTALEAYDQRFSKMREAELLVLDDLGAHQSSPWASEKLFQLLNYRYNSGYPTVITANMQGLSSLDERIRSRLSDTALVISIQMNGAIDFRRQNPRR